MPAFADRVLETATTTGVSDFTTAGARTGYETFNTAFGTNMPFYYAIIAVDGSDVPTGQWEVGVGYLSASTTLVRETVMQSSSSDAAVDFAAGTKLLFSNLPAEIFLQNQFAHVMLNPMIQL